MKFTAKLQVQDNWIKVKKDLTNLTNLEVYVGIPEEKADRRETKPKMNNAQLAYIHTHGSPVRGIPARPIIQPAIAARGNREPIAEELRNAAKASLSGDASGTLRYLKRAGMTAANAARSWFTDPRNGWQPNAPATIAAKGSSRPLIDTGQLRKSITYVIGKKK